MSTSFDDLESDLPEQARVVPISARRKPKEATRPEADPDRRIIEVQAGELSSLVAQGEAALIATDAGIFQRGGQLVRIAILERDTAQHGVRRTAGSTVIMPVTRDYLPLALGRAADWQRWDKREKALRRIDPPAAVSTAMIASAGEWKFPPLAGIVTAPTLRSDATLLDASGYDANSHLFAAFNPNEFPVINRTPSREEALEALQMLDDLFGECIFTGGNRSPHASVAIAASITACVRHALPTAPAFAFSAHKAGSGKTTTAKAVAQLSMGRDPPVIAPTDDEAEFKKALLAILIAGDAVVLIDNVAKPIDSAAFCAALTTAFYSDRILGVSQKVSVPTTATWLLTGNSIEFVGDLTTRVLLSVLDPEVEHPEARPFRRNLAEYVLQNRGALVAAALTVPLAYAAAGSPKVNAPRSRFTEWDALVRNPLLWLGAADPLDTQAELRATDPFREALVALLTAWRDAFDTNPASVANAVEAATATGMSARPQLLDAINAVAGERNGGVNNRRLGRYLTRNIRRIEGGSRFEDAGTDLLTKNRLFRVAGVTGVTGVSTTQRAEICR
jgi:putative DNA primase/helicase